MFFPGGDGPQDPLIIKTLHLYLNYVYATPVLFGKGAANDLFSTPEWYSSTTLIRTLFTFSGKERLIFSI
jgi:hypothetical protein